ncbi:MULTISPECIES: hypothetical protein [Glycomyces]|uniref:Uncharacterized protein n=2 Tax=Glycomyces TaxID=58113 RepID=A0A9X3SUK7_9ACTN|nr:hypothetical protein [Glycomyces lechevalierae]MDA1385650.1 hypothetical protein [Glycomyces lechevalierae]MDR7339512.1 hypothetical protein [Glycomyces lechevalierae]
MDTNSREAVTPDPLITVEAAPSGHRGVDWTPAQNAAPIPVPVAVQVECPHRITVWDLKGANQIVFAVAALLVFASGLLGFAGLAFAVAAAIVSMVEPEVTSFIAFAALALLTRMLIAGFLACVRIWKQLHRPDLIALGLSVIAPLAVFAIAVFMMTHGAPAWVLLLGVPPVAVMVVLGYFRAVLYHPGTCGSHPWLPVKIQQLVRA